MGALLIEYSGDAALRFAEPHNNDFAGKFTCSFLHSSFHEH